MICGKKKDDSEKIIGIKEYNKSNHLSLENGFMKLSQIPHTDDNCAVTNHTMLWNCWLEIPLLNW